MSFAAPEPDCQLVGPYTVVDTGPVHVTSVVADRVVVAKLRYPGRAIWKGLGAGVAVESLIADLRWPWCVATRFSLHSVREVTWFDGGHQVWIEYGVDGRRRRVMTCVAPNDLGEFEGWWEICRPDCRGLETLPVRAMEIYQRTLRFLLVLVLVNLVIALLPAGLRPGWLPMFQIFLTIVAMNSTAMEFLTARHKHLTYRAKHRLRFGS
jgi:hypothetical protein